MMSWRGTAALVASCGCSGWVRHGAFGAWCCRSVNAESCARGGVCAGGAQVRCPGPERQPTGVPVPARFVVVAAIRCIQSDQVVPGHGLWQFDLWQVAGDGLTSLAEVLRRPSATPPPGLACAEPGISVPPFTPLLGGNGRMIYPKLPTEECGNPQRQVLDAVQALHWMTVLTRRGQQVETQAGIESGCPGRLERCDQPRGKLRTWPVTTPLTGRPGILATAIGLRVCVYQDRRPSDTFLIGGSRISGAAETALLAGIAAGRSSATCPQPHTMFAVLLPP